MKSRNLKKELVVAIEVGNLQSGYSFGVRKHGSWKIYTARDNNSTQMDRVPTNLLLADDLSLYSFGVYAKEKYMYLTLKNEHEKYMFIDNLNIYCGKDNKSYIHDFRGKPLLAEHIYLTIINQLIEQCMNHVAKYKNYYHFNKYLIFVVPRDVSKELKDIICINIKDFSSICFVSSSEAGLEYCLHQDLYLDGSSKTKGMQSTAKYAVVNFGKDTTTVCYQEILPEDNYNKLETTNVECGGSLVTDSFIEDVKKHYGMLGTWNDFRRDHFYDYMYIRRMFDHEKHKFNNNTENVIMEMPASVIDLGKENINSSLVFHDIEYKIVISKETMRKYFRKSLDNVISKIQTMCDDKEGNYAIVLLLGGFSESSFVRDNIEDGVNPKSVILVPEPSLAVLKGAVMLGFQNKKKANETYGFISHSKPENSTNCYALRCEGKEIFFIKIIDKNQILKNRDSFVCELQFLMSEREKPIVFYQSNESNQSINFIPAAYVKPRKDGWAEKEKVEVTVSLKGYNAVFSLAVIYVIDDHEDLHINRLFE